MKTLISNRKAHFEYKILDTYTAGIQLKGSEVKSIRNGNASIGEAYCFIVDNEIFIKGMHVSEHKEGGKHNNHQTVRDRKLLLNKKEILKLSEKSSEKGLTVIPLEIILNDRGLIKLNIGLAKGKNLHDKKQAIKLKDLKRDLEKELNNK
jgi:SsrA-binding protein